MKTTNTKGTNQTTGNTPVQTCVICQSTDNTVAFKGKSICKECVKEAIQSN